MPKPIQVSASILCADFTQLREEIRKCENAGIDMIHVDVMDGHFVPNITIGAVIVEALRSLTKLPVEAHLMVERPDTCLESFLNAGADIISLQVECYGPLREGCREFGQYPKEVDSVDSDKIRRDIEKIRQAKRKVFLVANPGTPLCFDGLLKEVDGVVVMSVNPGFAKQKFMPGVLPKIQQLRNRFDGDIVVDGGINELTAPEAVKAGANILATASYFFGSDDPRQLVQGLQRLAVPREL